MGYNCQRRPAPDSCVASLICSPGDLHSSRCRFGCGVTYKQAAICCHPPKGGQRRTGKAMQIEDASSFHINHQAHVRFCYFEVRAEPRKEKYLFCTKTGRKIWFRNAVQNTGKNRAKGRRMIRDPGRGREEGRSHRGGRKGRGEERGGARVREGREEKSDLCFLSQAMT